MKKFLIAALLAALSMTLSCSGPAAPVSLTFWTTSGGPETEFLLQRIQNFERDNPGIKVQLLRKGFPEATNEFKTAILGDQAVDVFRADNTWISEYVNLGIVYPLHTLASESEDLSGFMASSLQVTEDGGIYAFPSVMEVPALLYNKRMLKEAGLQQPPATMNEMLAAAKALTHGEQYGLYISEDSYFALPYLWAFGGGMVNDNSEIMITSENSRNALEFMLRLRKEGVTQPYRNYEGGYNRMMSDFASGKVAMIINGSWALQDILDGKEFAAKDNLGIAPIPSGPKGQGSPVGGHSLVINRYSKYPRESYALIRYLTSAETQVLQSRQLKTLPAQQVAYQDERLASDPYIQSFKTQLEAGRPLPDVPKVSKLFMDFTSNLSGILLEKQSVQEGTEKIAAAWRSLLKVE